MKAGRGLLTVKGLDSSWAEEQTTGRYRQSAGSVYFAGVCKRLGVRGSHLLPRSYLAVTSRNLEMRTADNVVARGLFPNFPDTTFLSSKTSDLHRIWNTSSQAVSAFETTCSMSTPENKTIKTHTTKTLCWARWEVRLEAKGGAPQFPGQIRVHRKIRTYARLRLQKPK